jgi:iron complex outermembrane receptor protein
VPFVNGIKGHSQGIEIAPDWKPISWWDLKGSYSYLHLSLRDQPGINDAGTVASDIGSSPKHMIEIQSEFNLPKRFEFDQTYRYSSALPAQLVRAYQAMDARVGWNSPWHLEFSVVGRNLFQPQHFEFGGDPGGLIGIRRAVYGKITWRQ